MIYTRIYVYVCIYIYGCIYVYICISRCIYMCRYLYAYHLSVYTCIALKELLSTSDGSSKAFSDFRGVSNSF